MPNFLFRFKGSDQNDITSIPISSQMIYRRLVFTIFLRIQKNRIIKKIGHVQKRPSRMQNQVISQTKKRGPCEVWYHIISRLPDSKKFKVLISNRNVKFAATLGRKIYRQKLLKSQLKGKNSKTFREES